MRISVFGLGYVGAVSAACLANDGHEVIGVDVNSDKVDLLGRGKAPIIEPGLDEMLDRGVNEGRIKATTVAEEAVRDTDISLISVGTPPTSTGEPDLSFVYNVCKEIAEAVRKKGRPHVAVLRSTVPPGTLDRCFELMRAVAGEKRLHVAFNPEFLREGAAIKDYYDAPYTIIGTEDPEAEKALREMYESVESPTYVVKPAVAEMVKYAANTWHAVKVVFGNEIGRVAKAFGVDGRQVMDLICRDTKLNVSPAYLRPGFAYGGSCLPKDLSALLQCARAMDVSVPFLDSVRASNNQQIELAVKASLQTGAKRIAVFGLAFKGGTDDLRESPAVPLIKSLLGEGCKVSIYDPSVNRARLMGTNLSYIQRNLPHFEDIMVSSGADALRGAELVILTYASPEFRELVEAAPFGLRVLDLAGVFTARPEGKEYHALGW